MAHTIKMLDPGIVEIVHTGDIGIEHATASRIEAAAIMNERGLRLVLADVSRTNHVETPLDLLEFNATHYDVFPRGSRIAVVIPSDPEKAMPARFAETVAVNRGIAMRIFLEHSDAVRWLKQQGAKIGSET